MCSHWGGTQSATHSFRIGSPLEKLAQKLSFLDKRTPVNIGHSMVKWPDWYPLSRDWSFINVGFRVGFRILFSSGYSAFPIMTDNLKSLHEQVVDEVPKRSWVGLHCWSLVRVFSTGIDIEKRTRNIQTHTSSSHLAGLLVNYKKKEEPRTQYEFSDKALSLTTSSGAKALLAKAYIESAFRLLPVYHECFHLLGCYFQRLLCRLVPANRLYYFILLLFWKRSFFYGLCISFLVILCHLPPCSPPGSLQSFSHPLELPTPIWPLIYPS